MLPLNPFQYLLNAYTVALRGKSMFIGIEYYYCLGARRSPEYFEGAASSVTEQCINRLETKEKLP